MAAQQEKKSKWPYIVGSALSGILEVLLFHPADTITKRKMSGLKNEDIFNESLYAGILYGLSYKIIQRTYKFSFQPLIRNYLNKYIENSDLRNGVSGAIVGVGEGFINNPLDIIKIKMQCNPTDCK